MTHDPTRPDFDRRDLLKRGLAGSALLAGAGGLALNAHAAPIASRTVRVPAEPLPAGPFELPPLPYPEDALAPHVSANTLSFHHGKHHRGYVDNLNKLVAGKPEAERKLEELVASAAKDPAASALFNNAGQAWNHAFYWRCMKKGGGGAPRGALLERLASDLGGVEGFKKEFAQAATSQFGSGWAWLVIDGGKLKIEKTANADTPLAHGRKPLLVIDVWEHAYYLDYQNRRADHVAAWLEHLVDWDFASANLG